MNDPPATPIQAARRAVLSAVDSVTLIRDHYQWFSALFNIIRKDVDEHSVAYQLADIGRYLADDMANITDGQSNYLNNDLERLQSAMEQA